MSEMEMTTDVETEIKEFAYELSDEALDREQGGSRHSRPCPSCNVCHAGN